MLNRFFKLLTAYLFVVAMTVFFVSVFSNQVFAQKCDAIYETITRLHHPDPGAFMVWNSVYGNEKHSTKFVFAIESSSKTGNVIAAGEVKITSGVRPALLLVEYDRRGRKIWGKIYKVPYMEKVIKIASDGDGYVVVANISAPKKHNEIWIGFIDGAGKLKSYKIIGDKKFDLFANDLQPKIGGGGWMLPVTATINYKGEGYTQKNSLIFILDNKGNKINSRSYILGVKTEMLGLTVSEFDADNTGYIATGYFENNSGKNIAWVLRLNQDLSMVWQKEFSRGVSAKAVRSYSSGEGGVIVAGDVDSANSKSGGVWLAKLGGVNGAIDWQRYYMSKEQTHTYSVRGINVNNDGLIALLMKAEPIDKSYLDPKHDDEGEKDKMAGFGISDNSSYGHLITLSPLGVTMSGDAFYYGQESFLSSLSSDNSGRRIMAGLAIVKPETEIKEDVKGDGAANPPLHEQGDVHLPDVDLSDKAKKGLALLQKKINEQSLLDQKEEKESHGKLAKHHERGANLVQKGWVVLGDMPDKYVNKCK